MKTQDIFQQAKEQLLAEGEHLPTLFVAFQEDDTMRMSVFADFPYATTLERQKALFALGRKQGEEAREKTVKQVAFIIEAWAATYRVGEPRRHAPSEDPNRREVLILQTLTVMPTPNGKSTIQQTLQTAELLRDGNGTLIDLLPSEKILDAEGGLLVAFLAGFESAKLSDDAFAAIVRKASG